MIDYIVEKNQHQYGVVVTKFLPPPTTSSESHTMLLFRRVDRKMKAMNLFLLSLAVVLSASASVSGASPWPHGAKAAVSLTYDDSPMSHLDIAIPALDRAGLKGTFFVNPGQKPFRQNKKAWAKVAKSGHEIGSHTMTHPCTRSFDFVPKGQGLEDLNTAQITAQIDDTIKAIKAIGVREVPSFAYPCGQSFYGEDKASYIPIVKKRHLYARSASHDKIPDPATVDLYQVPVFSGATDLATLTALAEEAARTGGWLVIIFHGVGGDHLAVDGKVHEDLLKFLATRSKDLWVAPFGEVGKTVSAFQSKGLKP